MSTQIEIQKRHLELADRIANGQSTTSLLKWYDKKYHKQKTQFYEDYSAVLDKLNEGLAEKSIQRKITRLVLILETAIEGAMKNNDSWLKIQIFHSGASFCVRFRSFIEIISI